MIDNIWQRSVAETVGLSYSVIFFYRAYLQMPLTWIYTEPTLKNTTVFKAVFATSSVEGDSNLFTRAVLFESNSCLLIDVYQIQLLLKGWN